MKKERLFKDVNKYVNLFGAVLANINERTGKSLGSADYLGYVLEERIQSIQAEANQQELVKKLQGLRKDLSNALSNLEVEYEHIFHSTVADDPVDAFFEVDQINRRAGLSSKDTARKLQFEEAFERTITARRTRPIDSEALYNGCKKPDD